MNLEDIGNLGGSNWIFRASNYDSFSHHRDEMVTRGIYRQQRERIFQSNLALELSLMGRKVHEQEHRWLEVTSDMKQPYDKSLIGDVFTEEELDFLKCRMNSVVWQANIVAE